MIMPLKADGRRRGARARSPARSSPRATCSPRVELEDPSKVKKIETFSGQLTIEASEEAPWGRRRRGDRGLDGYGGGGGERARARRGQGFESGTRGAARCSRFAREVLFAAIEDVALADADAPAAVVLDVDSRFAPGRDAATSPSSVPQGDAHGLVPSTASSTRSLEGSRARTQALLTGARALDASPSGAAERSAARRSRGSSRSRVRVRRRVASTCSPPAARLGAPSRPHQHATCAGFTAPRRDLAPRARARRLALRRRRPDQAPGAEGRRRCRPAALECTCAASTARTSTSSRSRGSPRATCCSRAGSTVGSVSTRTTRVRCRRQQARGALGRATRACASGAPTGAPSSPTSPSSVHFVSLRTCCAATCALDTFADARCAL